MCGFCHCISTDERQLACGRCPAAFSICGRCEATQQPCHDCKLVCCPLHMGSPGTCTTCRAGYQIARQQYQNRNRGRSRSRSRSPIRNDPRDPYDDQEQVQAYDAPVQREDSEDEQVLCFEPVDPEDDDSDWFRRRSDGAIFHIKVKGDVPICQRIEAASKLYRLLLGDAHAVLATALEEDPRTDEPDPNGDCFVLKPKAVGWLPLCSLVCMQGVPDHQTCMVRFPSTPTIVEQLQTVGEQVDSHGRFTAQQYCKLDRGLRVDGWWNGAVFVDRAGAPLALHGLHALSVVAWFLGESDMHSANFGVQPLGPGAFSVCVVDPSGGLALENLALPLVLNDYNNLPATAPQGYETNGGWHLCGDDNFTFAPTVGDLPGQDGAAQRRAAALKIKATSIDAIVAIVNLIDDDETRDEIVNHLRPRHARLTALFQ